MCNIIVVNVNMGALRNQQIFYLYTQFGALPIIGFLLKAAYTPVPLSRFCFQPTHSTDNIVPRLLVIRHLVTHESRDLNYGDTRC